MRKLFAVITVLVAGTFQMFADELSEDIIARMTSLMNGYGAYEVAFTATAKDMGTAKGTYTVSGKKYRIKVDSQEQFSDGKYRYEVNGYDKEVTIDNVNPNSRNLLTNPARAFDFGNGAFSSRHTGRQGVNDVIELVPNDLVLDGVSKIMLFVNSQTGLPVKLKYDFNGESLDIDISRIKRLEKVNDNVFEFSKASYKGYEVIDFR